MLALSSLHIMIGVGSPLAACGFFSRGGVLRRCGLLLVIIILPVPVMPAVHAAHFTWLAPGPNNVMRKARARAGPALARSSPQGPTRPKTRFRWERPQTPERGHHPLGVRQ